MWIPCPRTNTPRENVETPSVFQTSFLEAILGELGGLSMSGNSPQIELFHTWEYIVNISQFPYFILDNNAVMRSRLLSILKNSGHARGWTTQRVLYDILKSRYFDASKCSTYTIYPTFNCSGRSAPRTCCGCMLCLS